MKLPMGIAFTASILCLSFTVKAGFAQESFPQKPIRIVVPLGPGSGMDTSTRYVGSELSKILGKPVFVENKPGADASIGIRDVTVTSPPDGYTLLSVSGSMLTLNPFFMEKMTYDPKDVRMLAAVARGGAVLVTSTTSRYKSLKDLMVAAQIPGKVTVGTYGQTYRTASLRLQKAAKVSFIDVPYKAPTAVITDVLGDQVDATFLEIGSAIPLIQTGKLRALGTTYEQRHAKLPDVPTIAEQGYPDYNLYLWLGLGINAKTPEPIVKKLEDAILQIAQSKDFAAHAEARGSDVYVQNGKQISQSIEKEVVLNRELFKRVNYK